MGIGWYYGRVLNHHNRTALFDSFQFRAYTGNMSVTRHPKFPTPCARDWRGAGTINALTKFQTGINDVVRFLPKPQKIDGMELINNIKVKIKNGLITREDLNTIFQRWITQCFPHRPPEIGRGAVRFVYLPEPTIRTWTILRGFFPYRKKPMVCNLLNRSRIRCKTEK